ncbi:hypothetical protein H4R18_000719 [Coemansia javaensis]|uniref:Uncharacterized protein n=1 Tax=Coemansia javaensis TaxID=2761396 RepID=A0A9W8HMT4_9FUNG|nr:hypothetical protein H4R18_000719 [Coemansia javaensis]
MKFLAALVAAAATVVVAQEVGSSGGPVIAEGPSAVSNANINNGEQFQNSVVSAGDKGGNVFHGLEGNTFTDSISNVGLSDNNIVNPGSTSVSGNSGPTANGASNFIGDFFGGAEHGGRAPYGKRDAVFNNNNNNYGWAHPAVVPAAYAPAVYTVPVYAHPAHYYGPAAFAPHYYGPAPVAGHVNHNVQSAAIVQNQY